MRTTNKTVLYTDKTSKRLEEQRRKDCLFDLGASVAVLMFFIIMGAFMWVVSNDYIIVFLCILMGVSISLFLFSSYMINKSIYEKGIVLTCLIRKKKKKTSG